MIKKLCYAVAVFVSFILVASIAEARMPVATEEVVEVVQAAHVLKAGEKISVSINNTDKSLIISAYTEPKIPDRDLKINSVLICKSVLDKFPDVLYVRCMFYNRYNPSTYRYVLVQKDIVLRFGQGDLDDRQLLGSLTVGHSQRVAPAKTKVQGIESYRPVEGIYKHEREMVLLKIKKLKETGGNAQPFFEELVKIDREFIAKNDLKMSQIAMTSLDGRLASELSDAGSRLQQEYERQVKRDAGPFYDRRMQIVARIQMLEASGKDLSTIKKLYEQTVNSRLNRPGEKANLEAAIRYIENKLQLVR
ncbi:hypothetical protein GC174_07395 [bacterium]|nr:hypothetical protein [bacterium]